MRSFYKTTLSLLALILLTCSKGRAQNSEARQLSMGYYGNIAANHGFRFGSQEYFNAWLHQRKNTKYRIRSTFVSPQIGFFTQRNIQSTIEASGLMGFRQQGKHRQFYHQATLGLAYWLTLDVTNITANLQGELTKTREAQSYFGPLVGYEAGWEMKSGWSTFTKINYGQRLALSQNYTSGGMIMFELGVKTRLKKTN